MKEDEWKDFARPLARNGPTIIRELEPVLLHSAICSLNLLERFIESTNGKWGKRGGRKSVSVLRGRREEGGRRILTRILPVRRRSLAENFPFPLPFSSNLNNFFISFDFSTKEEEDFLKRRDRAYIIIKHSIFYVKSADNVKILRTVYRFFFFLTNINELCPLIVHRTSEK